MLRQGHALPTLQHAMFKLEQATRIVGVLARRHHNQDAIQKVYGTGVAHICMQDTQQLACYTCERHTWACNPLSLLQNVQGTTAYRARLSRQGELPEAVFHQFNLGTMTGLYYPINNGNCVWALHVPDAHLQSVCGSQAASSNKENAQTQANSTCVDKTSNKTQANDLEDSLLEVCLRCMQLAMSLAGYALHCSIHRLHSIQKL